MFKNIGKKLAENTENIRVKAAAAAGVVVAIIIAAAVLNKLNSEPETIVVIESTPDPTN